MTTLDRLSQRQLQCLELVAEGYTSKEIARQLGLSPSTVDNHLRSVLERLNMSDRAEASRFFREVYRSTDALPTVPPTPPASLFRLPPLGGTVNRSSARQRIWHVVQIAMIGIMGMTAAIITIAGVIELFGKR